MIKSLIQVRTLSLVFLGDFNPVIIQPFWLAEKKLIKEQEAVGINVELIHNELAKYELSWASLEITKKRFELRTSKEPYFDPLKDLLISIFSILNETPINALGINHIFHIGLPDKERYYEFGNKLAPLKIWDEILSNPRVLQLEVTEESRKDGLPGYLRVKINPSDQKIQYGVSININDHYSIQPGATGRKGELLTTLKENWVLSNNKAFEIVENLWDKIYR